MALNAGAWSTVSAEGYVTLGQGTHVFYVMVDNGTVGTLQMADAISDGFNYCVVTAWPL